jgi:teichoic acid transport system permease protein
MKSVITIIKEQINSFYLIIRLSLFELKSENNNNYLGILWELLNPLIQVSIYFLVFGIGIRGREGVGDDPYLMWMLAGINVWFLFYQATLHGSKSIYTRIRLISKMSFPMSVIPTYVIVSKLYSHLMLLGFVIIILQFTGYPISVYYIQLPYYMFATLSLILSISLITSTLSTIVRDVQMVVQSVLRFMLYLTPFLWTLSPEDFEKAEDLQRYFEAIFWLNPLNYIVEGYRAALLGHGWHLTDQFGYSIYFWSLTIILFSIGSILHLKFRNHFVDYL